MARGFSTPFSDGDLEGAYEFTARVIERYEALTDNLERVGAWNKTHFERRTVDDLLTERLKAVK